MNQPILLSKSRPQHLPDRRPASDIKHDAFVSVDAVIRFGRYCVVPPARQLLIDGQPVKLGGRAFDILMVLIEAPGTLVTKDDIMSRVWPNMIVQEINLKVQIAALRRVLNADGDVIRTVHGRGYVFVAAVDMASDDWNSLATLNSGPALPRLGPARATAMSALNARLRPSPSRSRKPKSDDDSEPILLVADDYPDVREGLEELLGAIGRCIKSAHNLLDHLRHDGERDVATPAHRVQDAGAR
jgi:DNA-binding winged helix-turn-helix (wHTH) protein